MTTPDLLEYPAQGLTILGWRPIWIVYNTEGKLVPLTGTTGYNGTDLPRPPAAVTLAAGCPDGVMMFDVDQYKAKTGAVELKALEAQLGPLPPTVKITSRGREDPGGKLPYRIPAGTILKGSAGGSIEIIQRHHRWTWAPGTSHPKTGTEVAVYGPDGAPCLLPPVTSLPALPEPWLGYLRAQDRAVVTGDVGIPDDDGRCELVQAYLAGKDFTDAEPRGQRANAAVYYLKWMVAEGHKIGGWIDEVIAALPNTSEADFEGMWSTIGVDDGIAVDHDCCSPQWGGMGQQAAALNGHTLPAADPAAVLALPAASDLHNRRGTSDQSCAQLVLDSSGGALRYAQDADTWLIRRPDSWEISRGGAGAIIAYLGSRMPPGDAKSDDPVLVAQAQRKARFGADAGAKAIAGKVKSLSLVSWLNGDTGAAVRLGDLDQDPEVLWAGGTAWDLRASACGELKTADVDPAAPHLHHARFTPTLAPTPLWDAFVGEVWPWEDLRGWALRVLSTGVTGYSGKVLPILLGDTDHGKTSVVALATDVLGTYGLPAADSRLLSAADRSHASIVYALRGVRLALIDEAPRTGRLANEQLKRIAGGGDLTGNRMGENPVTFHTTHTLVMTANPDHEPVLTDPAVASRVRLIPCEGNPARVIEARAAIGDLGGPIWRAEGPGVLGKLIIEAGKYLADTASAGNAASPQGVRDQVAQLAAAQCPVMSWLEARCEYWAAGTKSGDLYETFKAHWRMSGSREEPWSITRWGRRLNELNIKNLEPRRPDGNYRALRIRIPSQPGMAGWR